MKLKPEQRILQLFYKLSGAIGSMKLSSEEKLATAALLKKHPIDEVEEFLHYVFQHDEQKWWADKILSPADLDKYWDSLAKKVRGRRQYKRVSSKKTAKLRWENDISGAGRRARIKEIMASEICPDCQNKQMVPNEKHYESCEPRCEIPHKKSCPRCVAREIELWTVVSQELNEN